MPAPTNPTGGDKRQKDVGIIINNQAINSTVTSTAVDTTFYTLMTVMIIYTRSAGTAVTMTVEASLDGGSNYGTIQELDTTAPPTLTSGVATWSQAVAGSETWIWNIPVNYGLTRIKLIAAAGTGSDLATVYCYLGAI
jgi:hypothetical protein